MFSSILHLITTILKIFVFIDLVIAGFLLVVFFMAKIYNKSQERKVEINTEDSSKHTYDLRSNVTTNEIGIHHIIINGSVFQLKKNIWYDNILPNLNMTLEKNEYIRGDINPSNNWDKKIGCTLKITTIGCTSLKVDEDIEDGELDISSDFGW